jgi:magnesium transporter
MTTLALTELLGATVYDPSGAASGRVREVTLAPQEDRSRISSLIVKTKAGNRVLAFSAVSAIDGGIRATTAAGEWPAANGSEGLFLLGRDLLDQQVIDVDGRKVVRVNDVDLQVDPAKDKHADRNRPVLRVISVDVGARGAVRRLLRGVAPKTALQALLLRIPPRSIPWNFIDVIETDPAPDERQAVFQTLDEETAAEALEEVTPRVQKSIVESLDSGRAADIVEEMDPDAAADLLAELPDERTEQILVQMEPEAKHDVVELLEHREETAAGRMTTDFLALPIAATVQNAVDSLREFEGGVEAVSTIYLVDSHGTLTAAVPLARLVLAQPSTPMLSLIQEPLVLAHEGVEENEVAELFDKYNLQTLPVVDDHNRLTGVITSDDVISMLRAKL